MVVAAAAVLTWRGRPDPPELVEGHAYAIPSGDERIVVEVLNASGRSGLARTATRMLRRAGIDVVYVGNAPFDTLDSTIVLARRSDTLPARRVAELLGATRAGHESDTTRRVDATVMLGHDFVPAAEYHP